MFRKIFFVGIFCCPAIFAQTSPFGFSVFQHDLIPSMRNGLVVMGDYDRDGDMDAYVSGLSTVKNEGTVYRYTGIQRRTDPVGNVSFVHLFQDAFAVLPSMSFSAATLGDYNNDGLLDMAMMGMTLDRVTNVPSSVIYLSRGTGVAMTNANVGLPALHSGEISAADFDNDGDQDILVAGVAADGTYQTKLYRNNGVVAGSNQATMRTFTEAPSSIEGMAFGDSDWGDYDRDGDQDLLVCGSTGNTMISKIYRNDNGAFTDINAPLLPMTHCSADWGDYDNDGDLDALLSGGRFASEIMKGNARIYRNNGNNVFADTNVSLAGIMAGAAQWGDYDNDGDQDILLSGLEDVLGVARARIYRNESAGTTTAFTHVLNLTGTYLSSSTFSDVDNDLDLDVMMVGTTGNTPLTNFYANNVLTLNLQPDAPKNPQAVVNGANVTLSWGAGSDIVTTTAGLSYNLRVGTKAGGIEIVSPLANVTNGKRLLYESGNMGSGLSWTLKNLPKGTYYWAVQTLDASYNGSPFTAEGTFVINTSPNQNPSVANENDPLPNTHFALKGNFPNPFNDTTVLQYNLPQAEQVKVSVFDVLGKEVRILSDAWQPSGNQTLTFDGRDASGQRLTTGMYLVKVQAGNQVAVQRMTLVN